MEKITIEDILVWIVRNSSNTDAMDKINTLTFTFTTRYKDYMERRG